MAHKSLSLRTINDSSDLEQTFWLFFQLGTTFQSHACHYCGFFFDIMSSKFEANLRWQWYRCHLLPPSLFQQHIWLVRWKLPHCRYWKWQMLISLRTNRETTPHTLGLTLGSHTEWLRVLGGMAGITRTERRFLSKQQTGCFQKSPVCRSYFFFF